MGLMDDAKRIIGQNALADEREAAARLTRPEPWISDWTLELANEIVYSGARPSAVYIVSDRTDTTKDWRNKSLEVQARHWGEGWMLQGWSKPDPEWGNRSFDVLLASDGSLWDTYPASHVGSWVTLNKRFSRTVGYSTRSPQGTTHHYIGIEPAHRAGFFEFGEMPARPFDPYRQHTPETLRRDVGVPVAMALSEGTRVVDGFLASVPPRI